MRRTYHPPHPPHPPSHPSSQSFLRPASQSQLGGADGDSQPQPLSLTQTQTQSCKTNPSSESLCDTWTESSSMKEQSPVPIPDDKDSTLKSNDDKEKEKDKLLGPRPSIPPADRVKGHEKGFDRAYRKVDDDTPQIVPCWILISLSHNPAPEGDTASGTATTTMKVRTVSRFHYCRLHHTISYYTTLHYTTLHYTTLHSSQIQYLIPFRPFYFFFRMKIL